MIVTTWTAVHADDTVRGADGRPYVVTTAERRATRCDVTMRPVLDGGALGAEITGRPFGDSAVALLAPGPVTAAIRMFAAGGIVIEHTWRES